MSLNDILKIEKSRIDRERVIYRTVYNRMKNNMNAAVKMGSKFSVYTIPDFILGFPLINIEKSMIYLEYTLTKEGFIHLKLDEKTLLITWNPSHLKELDKQIKQEERNERNSYNFTEKINERHGDDLIQKLISSKINSRN